MTLHRFWCPEVAPAGDRVRIEGAAAAQIRRVLRMGPGDRVILFGMDQWEYTVVLEEVQPKAAVGRIVARATPQAEPKGTLILAFALLKGERTEWVLQKGTELGVTRFMPMQTHRTIVSLDEQRAHGRQERYARIVREATEQCGRLHPPSVDSVVTFTQALSAADSGTSFFLHTGAGARLSDYLLQMTAQSAAPVDEPAPGNSQTTESAASSGEKGSGDSGLSGRRNPASSVTLLVGPEGGFTEEEAAEATARGLRSVSLGPRVLRAETAALAATALAIDLLER